MTITEVLQKIHVRYEKNTDYPSSTSEDFITRLAYVDDALGEVDKLGRKGVFLPKLKKPASIVATGSGADPLPTDFNVFIHPKELPAVINAGTVEYTEISMADGNGMVSDGRTIGNYFWVEGGNIITLPAITGTITFPYIKKITRYVLGTESDPIEFEDEQFFVESALAYLFLDDGDLNKYQAHINIAQEILETLEIKALISPPEASDWGFGM